MKLGFYIFAKEIEFHSWWMSHCLFLQQCVSTTLLFFLVFWLVAENICCQTPSLPQSNKMNAVVNMYIYGWFVLMFDRKQQNSVKQLSFNLKKIKKSEPSLLDVKQVEWHFWVKILNVILLLIWPLDTKIHSELLGL